MLSDRVYEDLVGNYAQQGDQNDGYDHAPHRMESRLVSDEIDTISSHHVEGGVGDIYDSGYTKDEGKADGEKGVYTPTDETAYDDVDNETHIPSLHRR
jgi:hypothetical protein